jgi:hypothetical protein
LGKILRWAVRLTSVPVFAMLMISLVPALGSFSISPREDKILALALCGIGMGFVLGWRWAGIGGALAVLSVAVVLTQGDNSLFADPFALAFGLQGLLFLISSAVNSQQHEGKPVHWTWLKRAAAGALALLAVGGVVAILRGPGATAIPKDKEAYVGVWENSAGFTLEITSEGRAKVMEDKEAKVAECNTPVKPGESGEFLANFRSDDKLELSSGVVGGSKVYHIDRRPFPQNKQIKMVLNGSDPYVRTNGLILIKKQMSEAKAQKPVEKKS